MNLNFWDIITVAYVIFAALKGRRRGLPGELPRLFGVTLVLFTGLGLYHWTGEALAQVNRLTGQATGAVGFFTVAAGSYFLVRHFRGQIGHWAQKLIPDERLHKRVGMIAGATRAFLVACLVLIFLGHTPVRSSVQNSFLGRHVLHFILPVYHIAGKNGAAR